MRYALVSLRPGTRCGVLRSPPWVSTRVGPFRLAQSEHAAVPDFVLDQSLPHHRAGTAYLVNPSLVLLLPATANALFPFILLPASVEGVSPTFWLPAFEADAERRTALRAGVEG